MKNNIKIFVLGSLLVGGLSSCNDFLDREPLDKVTPEKFFSSESDLASYTINAYPFESISPGSYGLSVFAGDNDTDNQASVDYPNFWIPGQKKVPAGTESWNWSRVRACNYFFDNVLPKYKSGAISGSAANVKHYIGEMYVIRAYNYFSLLKTYGDLPIDSVTLPDQSDVLIEASKRQPRNKVARFILQDLDKAVNLLSETAPNGKNRISKNVAYLLRARVALYEGTWEKYHKGTAFVPGGKGWPGNASDLNGFDIDSEIRYFLGEAVKSSKVVGDKIVDNLVTNTDAAEGMDKSMASLNPYYTMFCDENMEGYKEVLMWRQYVLGKVTHNIQMQLERDAGDTGWTRGLVNSFLMRNGLPIYANGSGYDTEWEKQGVSATLQNRDSRISIFTKKPGDINYYADDGTPDYSSINYLFGSSGTQATTGFITKKGKHYSSKMANNHDSGTSGSIVFRGTEAMLIYMEASYELNNTIDATADKYWRALRRRAKVDEDYTKTIAATNMAEEAKGDFGAYSHGQLISATLYNIRRERRDELFGEDFRWDDIKRWRACDQFKSKPFVSQGILFWGSVYEAQTKDKVIVDAKTGNMSAQALSNYILPYMKVTFNNSIATNGGFLFTTANYLEPIGMAVFRQTASDPNNFSTSVVYQNPGWSTQADTTPQDVE